MNSGNYTHHEAIQGAVCNQSHKSKSTFSENFFDVLSGGFWVGSVFDDICSSLVEDCGANPAQFLEESVGLNDFGNSLGAGCESTARLRWQFLVILREPSNRNQPTKNIGIFGTIFF